MCGMEIGALKKMLKKSTAVLILENGEPSIVVVDYNTYKELLNEEGQEVSKDQVFTNPTTPAQTGEVELLERINKDILALKEQIEEEEKGLGI
ncbi:MAG: hypothetical protein Q8P69_01135 [bacterium]|nr:hypothetical protein [bacterium]